VKWILIAGIAAALAAAAIVVGLSFAGSGGAELKKGDAAPGFSLPGSDGATHSLSDLRGKQAVVIAWFPKAFTGG